MFANQRRILSSIFRSPLFSKRTASKRNLDFQILGKYFYHDV